ncbi:KGGVGR-motif variant AAA ATPase [Streptomyces eurocidicus]|uniref:Mrp family chromosome partitioning ATPase n=1 Tax=Streptomyces eurocidicus TaxID=66423 RepID=A0A7W8BD18_STREU|nr:AAA family ATPase [Streptomyces eurocidicus]MBB5121164.1 Mrp family chromosome partitioning ATPase [Streptomyces eurocidicus]
MADLNELEGPRPPDHLFTWVDVDEHLTLLAAEGRWPEWLYAADGWWDGLELVVARDTNTDRVREWLDLAFGAGSTERHDGELMLGLDDPRTTAFTGVPVILSHEPENAEQPRRVPLLREKHITRQLADPLDRPKDGRFAGDVQLVAFHSFKGGVGRTVHAVAMADSVARRGGNVLLVDADLEAPGITWMHKAQGGQLDFCYADLLALLQGSDEGGCSAAIDIAAAYLPNQQVGRYPGTGRITVVPTGRGNLMGPPLIEPADLLTPGRSPYFLTEALAALAARVGADTVVVDLRAGASELSAPVLLDPRVQRVFVTTLSHQSLAGTGQLVRQLGRRAPAVQGVDPASSVIITQCRPDVHAAQVEQARDELGSALLAALTPSSEGIDSTTSGVDSAILSRPVVSPFREELLALPSSWEAVLRVLDNCKLADVLEPITPMPAPTSGAPQDSEAPPAPVDYRALRRNLADTANRFIHAEREGMSSASGFLVTDPLRRLLGDHRTEPPLALVVGAKGAGKTFMYAKACAARSWGRFAEQSQVEGVRLDAPVVPLLESVNLESHELAPQDLRDAFAAGHSGGNGKADSFQEITDRLKSGLSRLDSQDEVGWRRLWLECLAAAAGVLPQPGESVESALTELGRQARAVFVIDGLEDLLQTLDSEVKRTALRVLLIDVLAWLRSLRGRPLGLVVFVRQDLVTRAVRQNSGQLLGRYESYALRWDKEEALRLALWVAAHAQALPSPVATTEITELPEEKLLESLIQLWGWKMGTEKSKEARSHLWVPAALGDFHDQVQARDVVKFLAEAARLSIPQTTWEDRVLVPSAMRNALLECSKNKISAIQAENQEVGDLLARLQLLEAVNVPFWLKAVGLTVEEADFLVDSGVFAREKDGRFWVAEIYRHGLGFGSERRAKVLWRR